MQIGLKQPCNLNESRRSRRDISRSDLDRAIDASLRVRVILLLWLLLPTMDVMNQLMNQLMNQPMNQLMKPTDVRVHSELATILYTDRKISAPPPEQAATAGNTNRPQLRAFATRRPRSQLSLSCSAAASLNEGFAIATLSLTTATAVSCCTTATAFFSASDSSFGVRRSSTRSV